jgi:subtilase family serine protease
MPIWKIICRLAFLTTLLCSSSEPLCIAGQISQGLIGHIPETVLKLSPIGQLPPEQILNLSIGLELRNTADLIEFIKTLSDPSHQNYRKYLTPLEFTERFGPTAKDYQSVVDFAETNGLLVTKTHSNRLFVNISASVADVERVFHLSMLVYQHPSEARTFYAPSVEPSLDLRTPVLVISGLSDFEKPKSFTKLKNLVPFGGSSPGGFGAYFGKDFRKAYAPDVSLRGQGQLLGIIAFGVGFLQSDLDAYVTAAGLNSVPVKTILIDGFDGHFDAKDPASAEPILDLEMAVSMAPGLDQIIMYEGINNGGTAATNNLLNAMASPSLNETLALQLSASWSYPTDAMSDQIFLEFAAQGQSFFNASGDEDAYPPGSKIPSPCDNPYLTVVGGTKLTTDSSGKYQNEVVWNNTSISATKGIGTGGGFSNAYPLPDYQQHLLSSFPSLGGSTKFRNIPDVSMVADNVYVLWNGQGWVGAGTSCATPLWAGFAALLNEQARKSGFPAVGFLNPALYALGDKQSGQFPYYHTTSSGNNYWSKSKTSFSVKSSGSFNYHYNLCTGWGSPDGSLLLNALATPNVSLKISETSSKTFELMVEAPPAFRWHIMESQDLVHWTTYQSGTGAARYSNSFQNEVEKHFYKLIFD